MQSPCKLGFLSILHNKNGLWIFHSPFCVYLCILFLSLVFDYPADQHYNCKYNQIPHAAHTMAEDGSDHHKDAAAKGKDRQDKPPPDGLIFLFAHPLDQNGNIHQINGDDRQLGRIKDKDILPCPRKVGKIEIEEPCGGYKQRKNSGVGGHIGLGIQLTEDLGLGAFLPIGQGIHASGA